MQALDLQSLEHGLWVVSAAQNLNVALAVL